MKNNILLSFLIVALVLVALFFVTKNIKNIKNNQKILENRIKEEKEKLINEIWGSPTPTSTSYSYGQQRAQEIGKIIEQKKEKAMNTQNINENELVVQVGDIVSMNYTGSLTDGKVFDSNVLPEFNHVEPFQFILGAGQVIPGWDKNIVGMKIGEKKTLEISPEDAYGANGIPGVIPPNAVLIFEVELLDIIRN